MASGGPLPWLRWGGVEVANSARTISYLRAGLGSSRWELGPGQVCSVLTRGLPAFVSPAADPAPWYDPAEPGSATFLGLHLLDIQGYGSTLARTVTPRMTRFGGGTFAEQRRSPRTWKFRGAMISADDAGAEYGLRWLNSLLQSNPCVGCDSSYLEVRLACPPDDGSNDDLGYWYSYDTVLVDGPNEVEPWGPARLRADSDVLAGCRDWVTVEFTVTAGNPYLYKPTVPCVTQTTVGQAVDCNRLTGICEYLFGPPGPRVCCPVTVPARGTVAPIYTFVSKTGMGAVLLEAYASCPHDIANPAQSRRTRRPRMRPSMRRTSLRLPNLPASQIMAQTVAQHVSPRNPPASHLAAPAYVDSGAAPVLQLELAQVPALSTVVVDCARRTVSLVGPDNVIEDGSSLLTLPSDRSLEWIEVRDCDTIACVCARAAHPCSQGADTTVSIYTQLREG